MKTLVLFVLISAVAPTQEHAPTVEQCRADYRLWTAAGADLDFKDVGWKELLHRSMEMGQCADVDPDWMKEFADQEREIGWRKASVNYREASFLFATSAGKRELNFITRHKLMNQFLDEDAAGKR